MRTCCGEGISRLDYYCLRARQPTTTYYMYVVIHDFHVISEARRFHGRGRDKVWRGREEYVEGVVEGRRGGGKGLSGSNFLVR